MATIGVTCSVMASGNSARSAVRDSANSAASSAPPLAASSSAPSAILIVNHHDGASESKFVHSVTAMRLGAGRM